MSAPCTRRHGLFGPDSVAWRVDREVIVLAGGSCALLMQAAHPVVAAGVDQHSTYATDPFGRLRRTLTSSFDVVFGTRSRADAAIRRVNAIHAAVRGQLPGRRGVQRRRPGGAAVGARHARRHRAADLLAVRRPALAPTRSADTCWRPPRSPSGSGCCPPTCPRKCPSCATGWPGWSQSGTRSGHPRRETHRPDGALPERLRASDRLGRRPPRSRSPRCPIRCGASTASAGRRAASAASNAWPPSPGEPCRSSRRRCDSCRRRGRRSAG